MEQEGSRVAGGRDEEEEEEDAGRWQLRRPDGAAA